MNKSPILESKRFETRFSFVLFTFSDWVVHVGGEVFIVQIHECRRYEGNRHNHAHHFPLIHVNRVAVNNQTNSSVCAQFEII